MITVRLTAEQIAEACIAWANEHYEMHGKSFNRCEVGPMSEGRVDIFGDVGANVTIKEETTPCKHPKALYSHGGSSVDWECPDCGGRG